MQWQRISSTIDDVPVDPNSEPRANSPFRTLIAAMVGWALDAMDFVIFLMAIPALSAEFGFGPGSAGLLATFTLLSSAAGGVLFGALADRFGRVRVLNITILVYSFASLGTATSQSFLQLALWRALLGLGMGGEWAAGATLVSETWPAPHRAKAIGIMQSGWALGYMAAALLAAWILPVWGWRTLFILGVLPALFTFWVRHHIDEPEIWKNKTEKSPLWTPTKVIFSPSLRPTTVKAIFLCATVMFGYWGLFTWLPSFLSSPVEKGGAGLSLVGSMKWILLIQSGAFLGYLSFGFLADRWGRRRSFSAFLVIAALLVPFFGNSARSSEALLILGPLVGFFGHGFFSVFGVLLAELFPTEVRATAQSLVYNTGRAFSAFAPWVIGGVAASRGYGFALGGTSLFFLAGGILVFMLPETQGNRLK
ncbi:MAG: MFS transporter [Bdellovibrionales bacterium]|nr:MFS transporter [Bdellovibrionales bacterium]